MAPTRSCTALEDEEELVDAVLATPLLAVSMDLGLCCGTAMAVYWTVPSVPDASLEREVRVMDYTMVKLKVARVQRQELLCPKDIVRVQGTEYLEDHEMHPGVMLYIRGDLQNPELYEGEIAEVEKKIHDALHPFTISVSGSSEKEGEDEPFEDRINVPFSMEELELVEQALKKNSAGKGSPSDVLRGRIQEAACNFADLADDS